MFLQKKLRLKAPIPSCLSEDKSFFEIHFIHHFPFQFIPLNKGGCSENFLLKTPKQTVFVKKPHLQAEKTIKNITHNLNLVRKAKILAPKVLGHSPNHTLILTFIQGKSIPSPKIKKQHLMQLWQEYQKIKKIPTNQISKRPFMTLDNLYDLCQKRLTQLQSTSFIRTFLFQIICYVLNSFPKSELIHHPKKMQAIHGDFHNNNILFNKNKLSGIIDWEELTIGYASEDWLRYTFCLVERLFNYYQRRRHIRRVLKFLLTQKAFSKNEWAVGFDGVLLQKINKILNDKKLSLFRLFKAVLFALFWQNEKEWVLKHLEK